MPRSIFLLTWVFFGCAHGSGGGAPASSPLLTEGDHRVMTAKGHEIAYHVHGRGPYCILHSGGPGLDWGYDRMPRVEQHLTMIYMEPVGTGASAKLASPKEYTLPRYVEELDAFRAALGLDKVFLLGHSHGGFVAQFYAIAHQDHLQGLILHSTAPRLGDDFGEVAAKKAQEFFGDKPWFKEAMAALDQEGSAQTDEEITALVSRETPLYFADFDAHPDLYRRVFDVHAAVAPQQEAGTPFDTRKDLANVHVPTLIVVGARDFVTSVPFSEEIHAAIPGSKLVVFPHSGHMSHVEEPEAFAKAVAEFVAGK